jgi:hypothetical protein
MRTIGGLPAIIALGFMLTQQAQGGTQHCCNGRKFPLRNFLLHNLFKIRWQSV